MEKHSKEYLNQREKYEKVIDTADRWGRTGVWTAVNIRSKARSGQRQSWMKERRKYFISQAKAFASHSRIRRSRGCLKQGVCPEY